MDITLKPNIVFDYGNVLIQWDPHALYGPYFRDKEKEGYFLTKICNPQWNQKIDRGESFEDCIEERVKAFPEWEEPIRMYKSQWLDMCPGVIPGMEEMICSLKKDGRKIYGLSNFSLETFPNALERFPILCEINQYLLSGEVGYIKPQIEIFLIFLKRFNLKPEECIFIDDMKTNVDTAKMLGMNGVVFNSRKIKR